jgi:hypothetical protein
LAVDPFGTFKVSPVTIMLLERPFAFLRAATVVPCFFAKE